MIDRVTSVGHENKIGRAVFVSSLMLLAACGRDVGNGVIVDGGECVDHESEYYLDPDQAIGVGAEDMNINSNDGNSSDTLKISNLGNGAVHLRETDSGSLSIESGESTTRVEGRGEEDDTTEVDIQIGDEPVVFNYEEDGQSITVTIEGLANDQLAAKLVQECVED